MHQLFHAQSFLHNCELFHHTLNCVAISDLWPLSQLSHSAVSDNERSNLPLSSTLWLAAVSSIWKYSNYCAY